MGQWTGAQASSLASGSRNDPATGTVALPVSRSVLTSSAKKMIGDLSRRHELITDLFPATTTEIDWNQYRLTGNQIDFFHQYGYLAGIRLLDDKQTVVLRDELAE